jgi:uncharacterized protein (TIGR04255 family)
MAVHYENAPITEAIIDFKVIPSPEARIEDLGNFEKAIKESYAVKKKIWNLQGQFSMGAQVGSSATQMHVGYQFVAADGKKLFSARLDGASFHRLKPYSTWNDLRDEARTLWDLYRNSFMPSQPIWRVATRFINQIDIPRSEIDYKDYFLTIPEVSAKLPQGLSWFAMQLHIPQESQGMVILNQVAVQPPSPDTHSVVLDIDAFVEKPGLSDEEAWVILEDLREKKNVFFEGCITDTTRKLFGERREY